MFTDIYRNTALFYLGVMNLHPANSGPDMLLLLLKALISISAPSFPTRLTTPTQFHLLDRAGFRPVDRHEIVKEKSIEELNAQLVSLVGENGAEMLISAFRSRRSISGPELAG